MKKWLFLLALCLCSATFALPIQDRTIDPRTLSELAEALHIASDDVIAETQKRWLRKPGQERWEQTELSVEQRQFVLQWAKRQGLYDPWTPHSTRYDKALILGATTGVMKQRLDFLKMLWEEKVRFDEVVWLTGDRPLDQRVDGLTDRCKTESEAAPILWEEANLPEEMRKLPVSFLAVPMKVEGSSLVRPNTADTIVAWVDNRGSEPGTLLFVSSQPFCGYQFSIIKSILPDQFPFDLVGRGADPNSHPATAAITLDSIARWIYQDNQRKTNHDTVRKD